MASTLLGGSCDISSLDGSLLAEGTWGGDDAGAVVTEDLVHVHFGCTNGDFESPVVLDADGRFSVSGEYHLHVYPVATGPSMPAELAGVVRGRDLTMTVAVNDTIEDRLVVLGPVQVRIGTEPSMQMCPICAMPE